MTELATAPTIGTFAAGDRFPVRKGVGVEAHTGIDCFHLTLA